MNHEVVHEQVDFVITKLLSELLEEDIESVHVDRPIMQVQMLDAIVVRHGGNHREVAVIKQILVKGDVLSLVTVLSVQDSSLGENDLV